MLYVFDPVNGTSCVRDPGLAVKQYSNNSLSILAKSTQRTRTHYSLQHEWSRSTSTPQTDRQTDRHRDRADTALMSTYVSKEQNN